MNITSNLSIEGDYGFEAFYVLTGDLVGLIPVKEKLYTRIRLLDDRTLKISLMKSETQKINKYIKGTLRDGIFSVSSCNRVTSIFSFIKHWRTQKINVRSSKQQLLIFLSKTGKVQLGVFKDLTSRKKK
ncbi:hypothetical protein D1815_21660 [Aquimarina sp. AD1]|uniref:hypothetical protein n=1 Tax=Aquimarina sp. (strain AD1) TaxID=1714848 RepID=UPI000E50B5B7|nr:hypothetical protein [Aquimarina sp. AD1]AXT58242.1 hypothetical protein D1815_21660 [Aquimarina sp. AD1]RKN09515.1 hypothetical protein D7035_19830 [Aquimarina sp. AD1]